MPANKWLLSLMVPAALAVSLGACNQTGGATPPGYRQHVGNGQLQQLGDSGRVMAIREVAVRGGGSGVSNGTLVGGGLGAAGGAAIGAATTNSIAGALVGGLLGAVGGAIAGTAIDSGGGSSARHRGDGAEGRRADGCHRTGRQWRCADGRPRQDRPGSQRRGLGDPRHRISARHLESGAGRDDAIYSSKLQLCRVPER